MRTKEFIGDMYSQSREGQGTQGRTSRRLHLGQSEAARAAGGKLCSNNGVRCPHDWLVWITPWAGRELTALLKYKQEVLPVPSVSRVVCLETIHWSKWERTLWWEQSYQVWQRSRQHRIWAFSFRSLITGAQGFRSNKPPLNVESGVTVKFVTLLTQNLCLLPSILCTTYALESISSKTWKIPNSSFSNSGIQPTVPTYPGGLYSPVLRRPQQHQLMWFELSSVNFKGFTPFPLTWPNSKLKIFCISLTREGS